LCGWADFVYRRFDNNKHALVLVTDAFGGHSCFLSSASQGFGIVYLEAMACGVLTLGSTLDGSREALREGMLGIPVVPTNPEDIQHGILEALARSRGIVPKGLKYFSYANFEQRTHRAVEEVLISVE
jgi:glycosyltransferase involved in cell wall biosynthesis